LYVTCDFAFNDFISIPDLFGVSQCSLITLHLPFIASRLSPCILHSYEEKKTPNVASDAKDVVRACHASAAWIIRFAARRAKWRTICSFNRSSVVFLQEAMV
jgi:hypothetical protein